MSFPLVRVSLTRQESPMAASQAPKVSSTSMVTMSDGFSFDEATGIVSDRDKIIASRASRDIRRCLRWRVILRRAIILATGRRQVMGISIAKRRDPIVGLQDHCFLDLSYFSWHQKTKLLDF